MPVFDLCWKGTMNPEGHSFKPRVGILKRFLARSVFILLSLLCLRPTWLTAQVPPGVGQKAPDFTLQTPEGADVSLSGLVQKGKVVLIVLRGYPGYQCPYCQRQVHDFVQNAGEFSQVGAQILLVYPGPPAQLGTHAKEFLAHERLPSNVRLVIDPDYKVTNLYGLRWDAPRETAYPSTFIVDQTRKVLFRRISRSHGDRTTSRDVFAEITRAQAR